MPTAPKEWPHPMLGDEWESADFFGVIVRLAKNTEYPGTTDGCPNEWIAATVDGPVLRVWRKGKQIWP